MGWLSAFGGVVRYEYRMQVRRRSVWIVLLGLGLLTLLVERAPVRHIVPSQATVQWALGLNTILPLAFGILLADRLPRDEHLRIHALFAGLPVSQRLRLLGKYVGASLATMTPIVLVLVVGMAVMLLTWQTLSIVLVTLAAFLTINLPGLLFVAAFSLAVPLFMPVPVYQVLFTGYWFWGNLLSPNVFGIPTLSDSILTPIGQQRAGYFFGIGTNAAASVNPALGVASIAALALCAAVALIAAWASLQWRHERA
jgi:ABC-2 type transport system permease protein